ncbi:hypothetical protein CENSYa_1146 [Cenarchaeum symbiosum A]|uniref:Uncharacterized protein n=1 Tax=Cenarchaeum symbiosum (strain A) TaxID=414004 RepID=A0RWQ6_CENSY|nr:hypothetical protein CENSYa_1146 [Cenarchaeum symbiosum A]
MGGSDRPYDIPKAQAQQARRQGRIPRGARIRRQHREEVCTRSRLFVHNGRDILCFRERGQRYPLFRQGPRDKGERHRGPHAQGQRPHGDRREKGRNRVLPAHTGRGAGQRGSPGDARQDGRLAPFVYVLEQPVTVRCNRRAKRAPYVQRMREYVYSAPVVHEDLDAFFSLVHVRVFGPAPGEQLGSLCLDGVTLDWKVGLCLVYDQAEVPSSVHVKLVYPARFWKVHYEGHLVLCAHLLAKLGDPGIPEGGAAHQQLPYLGQVAL